MTRIHYALLGVGHARAAWFGNVAAWTTSGALPATFTKCLSASDAQQRLTAGLDCSALLMEPGVNGVGSSLLESAARRGVPAIVITDASNADVQSWLTAGARAVLSPSFTPAQLVQVLAAHAQVRSSDAVPLEVASIHDHIPARRGHLVAVCGSGAGASTIAMVAAQALARDVTQSGHVLLADFARNGEQAMLHDSPDIVPGVEEVVDMHRSKQPGVDAVRDMTFSVDARGYRLLLGQRRTSAWSSMPPTAIAASLASLRVAFSTTVADITADFDGEADGGSIDVEERNAFARLTVIDADLVLAVGSPGVKGVHSLAALLRRLAQLGVDADRIIPVVNRAPKRSTERAEIARALLRLALVNSLNASTHGPLFVPERAIEDVLRTGDRLPKQLVDPMESALSAYLNVRHMPQPGDTHVDPEPIIPGSLGVRAG
jgi:hypothetical protein